MSTHNYNRTKYYKIVISVAFSAVNDGDFQIQLFSNAMLAILTK